MSPAEVKAENERLRNLYLDFLDSFPNAKERIAWRVRTDNERGLAAKEGRLLDWTVNVYWPEIERKVAMAKGTTRGRPAKPTAASNLIEALEFVAVGTSEFQQWQRFVRLTGGQAVAFNGQIAAGYPIAEELTLCPQLDKLKVALARCGKSLVISETPSQQISVKGEKIRALVPCLAAEELPSIEPDLIVCEIGEVFKEAFRVCGVVSSEAGERVMEASLLLEANTCTGTNGTAILQFWHGYNLPPHMVLPKVFCAGVAKQTKKLTGFGFSWNHDSTVVKSVTFWFEGGAWIRTQCYEDRWQDVGRVLDVQTVATDMVSGLFEGIEAVAHFNEDGFVTFADGKVMSHDTDAVGAQYELKGLIGGKKFNGKLAKTVSPWVEKIDLTTYPDRAFFFGGTAENPVRGAIMGLKAMITESEPEQPEHPGEFDQAAE